MIWVDTKDGLTEAKSHFANIELELVGIDSEWIQTDSPSPSPSPRRYKVSILQIASEEKVFIFDMIRLSNTEESDALEDCLKPLFRSRKIWKVGYALNNDFKQLFRSYGYLNCFSFYESTLDFQRMYANLSGGLSRLTEKLLNRRLDKSLLMSKWEQRPVGP